MKKEKKKKNKKNKQEKKLSIVVDNITKIYNMYNSPADRLKEAFSIRKRSYHTEFYALKNVSFNVEKGEIVGIMGRNGAGKSTLLKVITGVLNPTYGNVSVSGRVSSLLELGAGFNMEYTGMENIFFYGTIMGLSQEEIEQRKDSIIEFAEIGDYIYQPVKTYSSGMFARLAFSCAINVEPEILIVDEILSVGDIRFQAKCFNKFKEFKKQGVTILYVGHDIGTMRTFCDRCIWMNQGSIVDEGDPTYISAKYVEFMYTEKDFDFTTYKSFKKAKAEEKEKEKEIEMAKKASSAEETESLSTVAAPEINENDRINRMKQGEPLAHWGSNTGLIQDISMTVNGKPIDVCTPWDKVEISFAVADNDCIDYEHFSVAFSIKSKEGDDMIIQTTYDAKMQMEKPEKNGKHVFRFSLEPRLTNGDYYLVLALENRKQAMITYYEYIEGAVYFKSFEPQGLYGKFLPDIKTEIEGKWKHAERKH